MKIKMRNVAVEISLLALLLLPQTGRCFYNPSTGRWISRDPIGERGGGSLYEFVANSPVDVFDYLGLRCCVKMGPFAIFNDKWDDPANPHQKFRIVVYYKKPDEGPAGGKCCNVDDCEFRQLIKGYFIVDGKNRILKSSGSGLLVEQDKYVDDGYSSADDIDPDRYRFEATDDPGVDRVTPTTDLDYYLNFRAEVIDKTTKKVVATKEGYWVKILGKFPRQLTHGGFHN